MDIVPCIKKNQIKKDKKKMAKSILGREKFTRKREREKKILSKIYESRTVGFHRSKKESSSTRRELRVVPKSWSFVKLHEVGNFPT